MAKKHYGRLSQLASGDYRRAFPCQGNDPCTPLFYFRREGGALSPFHHAPGQAICERGEGRGPKQRGAIAAVSESNPYLLEIVFGFAISLPP